MLMSLDEELEKRKAQMEAFYEAKEKERIGLISRPIELPNFMWERLDEIAKEMNLSPDQLLRVWLLSKVKPSDDDS